MNFPKTFFVYLAIFLAVNGQGVAQNTRGAVPISVDRDRSEARTALVIGNSSYRDSPLANPVNDATDIAAKLKILGFSVTLLTNANRSAMIDEIRRFGDHLRDRKGIGLLFYAGHGIQVNGRNYLVPVDADIIREHEVDDEGVDLGRVLGEMADARNRLNILILDACRNNPYERSFRSAGRGLASIDAPRGTLIAYATAPGSVAADGSGRNSPYTAALLKQIVSQDTPVEIVFKRTRAEVISSTKGAQIPWESSSLVGDFYFSVPDDATAQPQQTERRRQKRDDLIDPDLALDSSKNGTEKPVNKAATQRIRSIPQQISEADLKSVAKDLGFNIGKSQDDFDPNIRTFALNGKGFENAFEPAANGQVIIDRNSNLMWQQGGYSGEFGLSLAAARQYIKDLNSQNYAGYSDWRLPTVSEALTLFEPDKNSSGLHIHSYFSNRQMGLRTSDTFPGNMGWIVDFDFGECSAVPDYYQIFVRAVRNL
ncbi:MAG: caspase family protein [Calditrichia bacterium]